MEGDAVYAGKRFGRLTCAELDNEGMWLCRCDCGGEIRTDAAILQSGVITSCGCKKSRCLNLKGQRFGHLVVENPIQAGTRGGSQRALALPVRLRRSPHCEQQPVAGAPHDELRLQPS